MDEDASTGTPVGTLTATDPQNDIYYYSLSGPGWDLFSVDYSGVITLTGSLDYETTSSYSLTATVYDMQGYYDTASVTIHVNDIDQPPMFDSPSYYFEASGTDEDLLIYLGTVQAVDPEGLAVTYSLRAGSDPRFLLEQDGSLFFAGPDEPHTAVYNLTLDAADPAGNIGSADVTVNLTLAAAPNAPPEITNNPWAGFWVSEDAANGTEVGTITATDPDDDPITFSITAGNVGSTFSIDNSGVVKVANAANLDYDHGTSPYRLTIQASDGELTDTYVMEILLTNVNEAPTLEQGKQFTIAEDAPVNTEVGKIHAEDPDIFINIGENSVATQLNYEIIEGDDAGVFRLEGGHSRKTDIKLVVDQPLDFETKSQYVLKIKVWDNGDPSLSATATVIVDVTDVGPPVVLNGFATVPENSPVGTLVGNPLPVTMEGQPTNQVTWSITGGNPNGIFKIDANTGQVSVAQPQLDADTANFHTLQITAASLATPALTGTGELFITVTNVNEPPEFTQPLYQVEIPYRVESYDDPEPVQVVQVQATDPEGQAVTYAIVGGNADGAYTIDASTGQITLNANATPAVGMTTLQVQASDPEGLTDTALVEITVKPVVGITGDTHAVEIVQGAYQDTITITFVRYADQQNIDTTTLTVDYVVDWFNATASTADLLNAQLLTGTLTFALGESRKSILLVAVQDLQVEGIETVKIEVQATPDYIVFYNVDDVDKKHTQRSASNDLELSILDGVTLFGKMDQTQIALLQTQPNNVVGVDDLDYNGSVQRADYLHANPGIHLGDLIQTGLGNCWCHAGMAAVAIQNWQIIQQRIADNGDGSYTVTLYNQDAGNWESFTVSAELLRGDNMAQLSGDLDERGYAEIWTIVLEAAMAQMLGWEEMPGGNSGDMFVALVGPDAVSSTEVLDPNESDASIRAKIDAARNQGKTVVLSTETQFAPPSAPDLYTSTVGMDSYDIYSNHVYVVVGVLYDAQGNAIGYEIYNPHGNKGVINFNDLSEVLDGLQVHTISP